MSENEHSRVDRSTLVARLKSEPLWDLAVIGGGATGLGVAVDAALRGLKVVLLEADDFAKGSSSRATKLLHGGVRYLAMGQLSLVREALHERAVILGNAPSISRPLSFVMPAYRWWEPFALGLGLRFYERLAGRHSLGATRRLSRKQLLAALPQVKVEGLKGGVRYWDAQFDDAQLAIALARSASRLGALTLNHFRVDSFIQQGGRVTGLRGTDTETGAPCEVQARCIVNAAGVWVDDLRQQAAGPAGTPPRLKVSQGSHVVIDRDFWPSDEALLLPRTRDGRVLFAVPWLGKVILGTTEQPLEDRPTEPRPMTEEIDFILSEVGRYLVRPPTRADIRSAWAGLRPLVQPSAAAGGTARISREHAVWTDPSGLVCVAGGKWTTYRAMARDVLAHCIAEDRIPPGRDWRVERSTEHLPLERDDNLLRTGIPGADRLIAEGLSEQRVRFAVRHEFARKVEDVLARRSRLLFLDARAARAVAPAVADLLHAEGILQTGLEDFMALSEGYLP